MATGFAHWGVTWEPVKIHTDAGYTMTAFHVTGSVNQGPYEITRPAVVMQHGMGGNSDNWTMTVNGTKPDKDVTPMAI